ncbi:MAG TPA: ATP-binding cassette domain-containing protein [Chitinophagales bacterium]|nr:ATP-binding cassette domain-containing protein [Chitinophagales bacterium]
MSFLSLQNIHKNFATTRALDGVSFEVEKQSIFGMLGPNGAGKTTSIRIITTILKQDSGEVFFNGEKLRESHAEEMGYMPEERGLYKKMKVWEQLVYLAQLKGLKHRDAKKKVFEWMDKFEIKDWWSKKVQELSKGMSQKVQFIATILHEPKLIILDEPFSGLDPVNSKLIENIIQELRGKGATIIFSTHRMEQVEEICESIILINKGKVVLNGKVSEVKQRFKKHEFSIHYTGSLPQLSNRFPIVRQLDHELVLKIDEQSTGNDLLRELINQQVQVTAFSEILPSLNEIFIEQVEGQKS